MTNEEKQELNAFICEKFLLLKSVAVRYYCKCQTAKGGFLRLSDWYSEEEMKREEARRNIKCWRVPDYEPKWTYLDSGDALELPDLFAPDGLQLVKDELVKRDLTICCGYSKSETNGKWLAVVGNDEEICSKKEFEELSVLADTEAEALLLAVKKMLESESCR